MPPKTPETRLCTWQPDAIFYRDEDLVEEVLGKRSFTEVMFRQILGRYPSAKDLKIIDAVLVALMEHGLSPSAIMTRLAYTSAPENLQGAVAAGLTAVGSQFVGTMENNARLLAEVIADPAGLDAAATRIATTHRDAGKRVPGFGHNLHRPDDPRSVKLLAIAEAEGVAGDHVAALRALARAVDAAYGRHLTINATGATAALLGDIGIPTELMRGFAVVSRAAGLVAHIAEEQQSPSGMFIWDLVDRAIPYAGEKGPDKG